MAHTNHTTNYELSQFVANDKPTFLGDYNGDMAKIDTAIKAADNKAGAADTTAESAAALATSASQTATEAATDAATAAATATTALNTANNATTTAQNASTAAQSASTTASAAATKADAAKAEAEAATAAVALKPSYNELFARLFNMSGSDLTFTPVGGTSEGMLPLKGLTNTDGSLFKVYGSLQALNMSISMVGRNTPTKVKIGDFTGISVNPVSEAFDIALGMASVRYDSGSSYENTVVEAFLRVNTDGSLSLYGQNVGLVQTITLNVLRLDFPACFYVAQDFGD